MNNHPMSALVEKVLADDSKYRVVGQDEVDLFSVNDLKAEEWDYSLPTLTRDRNSNGELKMNDQLFEREFRRKFPFTISWENLLVAGGCPANIVHQGSYDDIDFFLYGLSSKEEATKRVEKLLQQIQASHTEIERSAHLAVEVGRLMYSQKLSEADARKKAEEEKYVPELDIKSIRNKNAITFEVGGSRPVTFQIILRLYKSKSEILHGFDLGSSAVGWDGTRLYFTTLSKFAHEYSCNIIDTTRRSTTYERRLMKYFERGFDIIIPALDVKQLSKKKLKYGISEVIDLPFFAFAYSGLMGNKIQVDRFLFHLGEDGQEMHDYQVDDLDEHKVFYMNLKNLSRDKEDFYFVTEDSSYTSILTARPTMSRRRVINYYDKMKVKIEAGKSPEIRQLRAYIKDLKDVGQLLIDGSENINEAVLNAIENEKNRLLNLVGKLTDASRSFPLDWKTDNPGSQLTGSFNPVFERPEKWYGSYYSKDT
jgi:hypothetical protein